MRPGMLMTAMVCLIASALAATLLLKPASDNRAAGAAAGAAQQSARTETTRGDRKVGTALDPGIGRPPGRASDILDTQNLPPRPADELFNLLAPRAEAGDRQAATQLYLVLSHCRLLARDTPPTEPARYVDPAILARQQESSAQFLARLEWNTLDSRAKEMDACAKIPATRIAEAAIWLQRAASAGDPYARLIYADRVEDVVGGPREMLADPQKVAQFKIDAIAYLQELSAMGSVEAMSRLGRAYQNGVLVGADPVMAYAYGLAAARAFGTAEPDVTTQQLESQLTAAELGRARLLANRISKP